jgi:hypothetical protein
MKANELMTGDLVRVCKDVCFKKGTIVKIHGIDADNVFTGKGLKGSATCVAVNDPDGLTGGVWLDYLEQVLLTSEILEQNGFKRSEGCTSAWDWHNGETSVHVSGNHTCPIGQTLTIYVPGGTVGAAFSSHRAISDLKIRGVHELQHALNLCHIDKKIKVKED